VLSAYDEQEDKRNRQMTTRKAKAARLENKLWDAYRDFKLNRRALSDYLDPAAFADLENIVVGTYEKARAKAGTQRGYRKKGLAV